MDANKATEKIVEEIMGYFQMKPDCYEPLKIWADMLIGVGIDVGRTQAVNTFCKPVVKYTDKQNVICVYQSLKEAANKNDVHQSNISRVCLGEKKTAGGFKWRYLNPNDYYKNRRINKPTI